MKFYAYDSLHGAEYKGEGFPHSFNSRADRDKWVAASDRRGTLRKREFEKKAREFQGYEEHAKGDFEGEFHPVYL